MNKPDKVTESEIIEGIPPGGVAPLMIGGVAVDHTGRPLDRDGWEAERRRACARDGIPYYPIT